jgi:hypothetical protein
MYKIEGKLIVAIVALSFYSTRTHETTFGSNLILAALAKQSQPSPSKPEMSSPEALARAKYEQLL